MELKDLQEKNLDELNSIAEDYDVEMNSKNKEELIYSILEAEAKEEGQGFSEGILGILPDGYGFLRDKTFLPGKNDIYVSPSQIKRFGLKNGDKVLGQTRPPKNDEHYKALLRVKAINDSPPDELRDRTDFQYLTPLHPSQRLKLEHDPNDTSTRIIDLFAPTGKGQRGLIVSPPKAGKTTLIKKIANGLAANHPEVELIVLLIDERPEEVTDIRRSINMGKVVAATFDQEPKHHTEVAELVTDNAKRLVEAQKDVVILMDSITRLARAYNLSVDQSGKLLSGGIDPAALYKPKEFFGAARNIEEGGSLTIIGTALVDTGSKLDQVVFEEFKGTGNMELVLDRKLANRRIYPAIDMEQTGTRKEDLLLTDEKLNKLRILRKMIGEMDDNQDALEFIKGKIESTQDNDQFLELMQNG
ncbi:MAG: transcription termination factor Rho [Candidatus Acetothermia bacterium]